MNNWVRPSLVGAGLGLVIGVIIILPEEFRVALLLPIAGFIIGKIYESQELRAKIRDLIAHFFQ